MRRLHVLALTVFLLALTRCGHPESPADHPAGPAVSGPPFVTATLDGAPWVADSVDGIVLTPSLGGVATVITATRRVSPTELHTIFLAFARLPTPGQYPLGGFLSSAPGRASFTIDAAGGEVTYASNDTHPGLLSVDAVNGIDSLLAGTFSFEASTLPDTSAHRVLSGQFRVRYTHPEF